MPTEDPVADGNIVVEEIDPDIPLLIVPSAAKVHPVVAFPNLPEFALTDPVTDKDDPFQVRLLEASPTLNDPSSYQ